MAYIYKGYSGLDGFKVKNLWGGGGSSKSSNQPSPSPPPAGAGAANAKEMLILKQTHEKEMLQMRLEMARLQQRGASPAAAASAVNAQHPTAPKASAADAVKAVRNADRVEKEAREGGVVAGSGGKTIKEALAPGQRQTRFMRSTNKVGRNLLPDDWRNLSKNAPANFDEAKYLARHPDIANAVKIKAMPSGLWHYLKYGKSEGRALAGWRRPGFLAGIFANWNQSD